MFFVFTVLNIVQSLAQKNNPVWYYGVVTVFLLDICEILMYYVVVNRGLCHWFTTG